MSSWEGTELVYEQVGSASMNMNVVFGLYEKKTLNLSRASGGPLSTHTHAYFLESSSPRLASPAFSPYKSPSLSYSIHFFHCFSCRILPNRVPIPLFPSFLRYYSTLNNSSLSLSLSHRNLFLLTVFDDDFYLLQLLRRNSLVDFLEIYPP